MFVGFVSDHNSGRDTLGIIWACSATIVACVWTSLHINVHPNSPTTNKIKHCIQCILGPDAYAAHAIKRLAECRMLKQKLQALGGEWKKWTLKQSFAVRLSGVHILTKPCPESQSPEQGQPLSAAELLSHATSHRLIFDDLPTVEQIRRRSKVDCIAKAVAASQVVWFAVDIILRLARAYDISLLETITAAYVICGIVMYGCHYTCPQDVQEPWGVEPRSDKQPLHNDGSTQEPRASDVWRGSFYVQLVFLAVFMSVHLAAWNYHFPSEVESWVWRSASMALGIGALFLYPVYGTPTGFKAAPKWQKNMALWVARPAYSLARITLIALAFASFREASTGIYASPEWFARSRG